MFAGSGWLFSAHADRLYHGESSGEQRRVQIHEPRRDRHPKRGMGLYDAQISPDPQYLVHSISAHNSVLGTVFGQHKRLSR